MTPNHSTKDLPDYIRHTMAQAVGASGHRIVDRVLPNLEADVQLQYANEFSPFHYLVYKPEFEKHREHLLLESAEKIKRMMESPLESRVIPEPTGTLPFNMLNNHSVQAREKSHHIPIDLQHELLFDSITQIPTDLRVYREILDAHPQHAEALWLYAEDHGPCPMLFDPELVQLVPQLIESMTAMYAAYATEMNELLGQGNYPIPETHDEVGQTLTDRLYVGIPQGHQGDVVATEAWASSLGIEEVYRWKRIEL